MAQGKDATWLRLWAQIDAADQAADIHARRSGLEAAIAELRQLLELGQKWPLYPLGYAYYCHPDHRPGTREWENTEAFLQQAISESVEPDWARLQLAFHRYDEKRFEESRDLVAQIQLGNLHENMAIRCAELQLCNHLWIGPQSEYPSRLSGFAAYIESLSEPAIEPILLMDVLEYLAEKKMLTSCQETLEDLDRAYPIMSGHWFRDLVLS